MLLAVTVEEADYVSDVSGDNCPSSDESAGKKVVDKQLKQSPSVVDRTYFFDSVLDKNVRNLIQLNLFDANIIIRVLSIENHCDLWDSCSCNLMLDEMLYLLKHCFATVDLG